MTQNVDRDCYTCGETKPLDMFLAVKSSRDGRRSYCKLCHANAEAKRRRENPETEKANADQRKFMRGIAKRRKQREARLAGRMTKVT